jgi:glycosyltransferase involved in cell wall biosynthesis
MAEESPVEELPLRAPAAPAGTLPGRPPRVSVLVPAYNAAETIGEALESALVQVPAPFEIVVSDDGSQDDLAVALRPFRSRIILVSGPNGGLAVARNRAAEAAGGELLALLDADDVWLPGRIRALRAAAAVRPDLSVLTTDAVESRAGVRTPGTYYGLRTFATEDQHVAILRDNFIFGAGAVRTEAFRAVGGYRAGTRFAEDWDLWMRLLLSGHCAGLIDLPLYEYRRRADSLTGQRVDLALGVLELLARTRSLALDAPQRRQLGLTEQRWRQTAASAAYRAHDRRARSLALRAAAGAGAGLRVRLRFGVAAVVPRRVLALRAQAP